MSDPYADSKKGRNWTIVLIVLVAAMWLAWYSGWVEEAVPGVLPKPGWLQRQEKPERRHHRARGRRLRPK